ncbi:MAG: PhnD/SsuA/transferrin family substrate-binding protein [Proteobacteria bacterium]|nr:PhnD/SsuA/transferrin family substrate-binding protein [Pseudomonadota bacterium]
MKLFSSVIIFLIIFSGNLLRASDTLKFGIYTADKPTTVVRQFRPLLNEVENTFNQRFQPQIKIKMNVAKSYEKGIEDIVSGKVHFARLGPASYIFATNKNQKLKILAMEAKKGKKVFNGVIVVHKDSQIMNIKQLKGKKFAFGNRLSTIGKFLSQQYLVNNGILASHLGSFEYLDRHDKVGASVSKGFFNAGALKEGTYKKLVKKGDPLRIIATFQNVTKPWVAKGELSADLVQKLRTTLLGLNEEESFKKLGHDGFLRGEDSDYQITRQAINSNDSFF